MTLIINDSGFMFEKDLGGETAAQVSEITVYDPDRSWHPLANPM